MSRGPGGAGRMGGKDLPFEVDPALEDQIAAYRAEAGDDDDWTKTLYPEMKVVFAPPPSPGEKERVQIHRELIAAKRSGPLFCDVPQTGKRNPADFNAFEDQATFNSKRQKRSGGLPNLKNALILPEFLPPELRDLVASDDEDEGGQNRKQKHINLLKKKRIDKLARFDENADDDVVAIDKDDEDGADENEERDEDGIEIPEDDDFSEDDDDLGNDYNAEKYFDDGDGVDDEGGDDGGGGEDACDDTADEPVEPAEEIEGIMAEDDYEDKEAHETEGLIAEAARVKEATFADPLGYHIGEDNVFCERNRAREAGDYLIRRSRELNGELVPKPAGGRTLKDQLINDDGSKRIKTRKRARRMSKLKLPDRFDENGHRKGFI